MTSTATDALERRRAYEALVGPIGPRLRRALVARFGVEVGSDVTDEALAWAWEHFEQVAVTANPAGYLYRVGQSAARRHRRWRRGRSSFPAGTDWVAEHAPELSGEVFEALRQLSSRQRVAVVMVHGYGFTYRDVADLLGETEAAVTNHIHRGLTRLRRTLGAQR